MVLMHFLNQSQCYLLYFSDLDQRPAEDEPSVEDYDFSISEEVFSFGKIPATQNATVLKQFLTDVNPPEQATGCRAVLTIRRLSVVNTAHFN